MTELEQAVFRDASRPIEERVADLLTYMTLDEKLAQIGCCWSRDIMEDGAFSPKLAKDWLAHGIGEITRIGGATALYPQESAALLNTIQRYIIENTRLGIPTLIHEESLAGYMARGATCYPQAIGLAATWEPDLVQQMADEIRQQMVAVGARQGLAPVLDIARDPRWGRIEETYGEDPYLASAMGVAYVKGLQTDDLSEGVAATGKHFIGYGASEGGLNWAPAHIPPRELREIYARPFEAAIREANIATIMNGYHEMDGEPCGASTAILRDLLRDELGFKGAIVADYFTVENLQQYHHIAAHYGEAARMALAAGIDIELPGTTCYGDPLKQAIKAGEVELALVDACVANMLRLKFALGLFEQPYVDVDAAAEVFETSNQRALARKLAQKSIVLLKNDGALLPLKKNLDSIAVIGPSADSIRVLQGDYHYPSHLEVMAVQSSEDSAVPSPTSALPAPSDSQEVIDTFFVKHVSVLDGIKAAVGPETVINYAPGCNAVTAMGSAGFGPAVEAAQASDVAVVVVGGKSGLTPTDTTGEAVDRMSLGLPGTQEALVAAIHATGTPVVVVFINGRPLSSPWIAETIPAIVEAWVPAEEGGSAVADILFGDVNPSGRLPVTIARDAGQVPNFYNHKPSGNRSHWYGHYSDGTCQPLYPFGHGLSYTTFEYADFNVSESISPTESAEVSIKVTNTGLYAGEEVVQLYVQDVVSSVTRPVLELKGFKRIALARGESKTVIFTLAAQQLAFYDMGMNFVVEPGEIKVAVGASSTDLRCEGAFTITGDVTPVPDDKKVFFSAVEVR